MGHNKEDFYENKPVVIGISGKTGAGKTTLAKALARDLNATILAWDEFDDISTSPNDYVDWFNRGENYYEFNYQALADALKSLKNNQSILHPVSKATLQPTNHIIFDAPLGHLHVQTGHYIDVCFHIETPLDVLLSRRLIRDFKENHTTKAELIDELEYYLSHSRPLFFDDGLKMHADFIADGMLTTEKQLKEIKKYLFAISMD